MQHHDQKGFTLLESLVAVAIMGTAVMALLAALSTGSIAVKVVDEKVTAEGIARSQLEYTQSLAYQLVPTTYATVVPPTGYSVTAEAFTVEGADSNIQQIVVTVYHHSEQMLSVEDYKVNR
ncbi:MAG: type II secretion system protein [Chloroflexi bacterium]|nr:type II secretion system protein [Chloroflexota bacterium]